MPDAFRHLSKSPADSWKANALPAGEPQGQSRWAFGGSLLGHATLLALMLVMSTKMMATRIPSEDPFDVEVLSPDQFEALVPVARPEPEPPSSPKAGEAKPPAMIEATTMLSGHTLADPRSRQARDALRSVNGEERMIQLCGLEAMEQVQRWKPDYEPDRVVAYAMSEVKIEGNAVLSDGAAFRSKGAWYALAFRCDLSRDRQQVSAFRFVVGRPIPANLWEARNLSARD